MVLLKVPALPVNAAIAAWLATALDLGEIAEGHAALGRSGAEAAQAKRGRP